jgi:hypothetical protein
LSGRGAAVRQDPRRPVDSAWLANAEKNLDLGQKHVQRLDAMTLPAVLEPVRSYLLASLRFSLDLERARFRYIKDGDVQPLRELAPQLAVLPNRKMPACLRTWRPRHKQPVRPHQGMGGTTA